MAGFRRNEKPGGDAVRAAARIFEEYGGLIRAVIRYQVHNRSEEEDLFQEFFITLVRKPVPAHVLKLKSYLYKAVINHVVDSGRRRQSYRRAVKKYAEEIGIRINNRTSGNASIENTEERNAVIAYFARHLQHREAQAFVLRYRDNFSNGQIAAEMGVDVKTVSRYLSDGLRRLRKALAT